MQSCFLFFVFFLFAGLKIAGVNATPESIAHTLANRHIFSEKFTGCWEAERKVHRVLAGTEMEVQPTLGARAIDQHPLATFSIQHSALLALRPANLNNMSYKDGVLEHLRVFAKKISLRNPVRDTCT